MVAVLHGPGVYSNYDGTVNGTMLQLYNLTIASQPGQWNFSSWIPQVVVINLGTNDFRWAAEFVYACLRPMVINLRTNDFRCAAGLCR
jgi:hypothetical protein